MKIVKEKQENKKKEIIDENILATIEIIIFIKKINNYV